MDSDTFNDYNYTRDTILIQLALAEKHTNDGSAVDAGCGCIEGKHLLILEGAIAEMTGFAKDKREIDFYREMGVAMKKYRHAIEFADWSPVGHSCPPCEKCG